MPTSPRILRATAAIVFVTGGCSGPKLVPVSGTITLDGRPASGVYVTFEPIDDHHQLVSSGATDQRGRYVLASDKGPGAVPGRHRVLMTTIGPSEAGDERAPLPPDRIPPKYQDGSVTYEVPPDGTERADFAVQR